MIRCCGLFVLALLLHACATAETHGRVFYVDCMQNNTAAPDSSGQHVLHSIEAANAVDMRPGDSIRFHRGTVCRGSLRPRGSGTSGSPLTVGAYGVGALPRIVASNEDAAVLRLFNQENFVVSSLDLSGSREYGVEVSGDAGPMHNISLSNLSVHDVRGPLTRKVSGLVVFHPGSPKATFSSVRINAVRAFNTTQWAGILVTGASPTLPADDVRISNSLVHDVQGDGIVLFSASHGQILRSAAWHTGMQHQQKIGTPNAIWTWQCNDCVVSENEAFLTDSPGVDGGGFDIDWGNTANQVKNNFAHETAGYCVSVFGANGPTSQSLVEGNLCLHNGLSIRLAQRQGAILLMTWGGGSIQGLTIRHNRVDWHGNGNVPVVRSGESLNAGQTTLENNEFHTDGTSFIDQTIHAATRGNLLFLENASSDDLAAARRNVEPGATSSRDILRLETQRSSLHAASSHQRGWRLVASVHDSAESTIEPAEWLMNLETAAVQFHQAGLRLTLRADKEVLRNGLDWGIEKDGVLLQPREGTQDRDSLSLISPAGKAMRVWSIPPGPVELGLALRQAVGEPVYGRLGFEDVRATD